MLDRPEHLYHGSPGLYKILLPNQGDDWGYAEGRHYGVYATSNRDIAIAFALGAKPDEQGKIERIMDPKYGEKIKMIFHRGHPNFGGKGYVYKLLNEGFVYTMGTQWVNPNPVKPVEISEINVDDYLHLFRYATEAEKKEIERELHDTMK